MLQNWLMWCFSAIEYRGLSIGGKCMGGRSSQNSPGVQFPAGRSSNTGKSTDRHLPWAFHQGSKGPQGPQPRVLTCLLSLLLFTQCNEPASRWDRCSFANFVIKIGTESCQEVNGRIWRSRVNILIKISWFSTANLFSSLYQDHKLFFVSKYCLWTPLIECHPIWHKA